MKPLITYVRGYRMYLFYTQRPVRLDEIQTLAVLNAPLS